MMINREKHLRVGRRHKRAGAHCLIRRSISRVVACLAFLSIAILPIAANDNAQFIKDWVASNIRFSAGQDGSRVLFMRRAAVRAELRLETPPLKTEVQSAVSRFADSSGLDYEFTSQRPNLIIAAADNVHDGERPNPAFLKTLGISDAAVEIIARTQKWPSGCGYYSLVDRDGYVFASLVAGDKQLPAERLKDCLVTGVIFSFGARVRTATFDTSQGYIQYLLLANSMAACQRQYQAATPADVEGTYNACIVDRLKAKLTNR